MVFLNKLFGSGDSSARQFYERGLEWAENGDLDQAIAEFTEAIRLDPNYKGLMGSGLDS